MASCSICDLAQKPRKVGEAMLREGLGVRDVADFCNWWLAKSAVAGEKAATVTKSAWDRHKNDKHFVLEEQRELPAGTGKFTTVEDIALEMVRRYGSLLEDSNWLPTGHDVREWAALMGKLNDLEQRRRDEAKLHALMAGAAFRKPEPLAIPAVIIHEPASGESNG